MGMRENFSKDEFYHLYNRGTDKRNIFMDEHDHKRFMVLLYLCNNTDRVNIEYELQKGRSFFDLWNIERGAQLVDIGAYCLMPNHFHLMVKEITEKGISTFMKKLSTAYSMYFNSRHGRTGSLFEGRFKSKHVLNDTYLKHLFAYVHLNPVKIIDPEWKERGIRNKNSARAYLEQYQYSSFIDYIGQLRDERKIITPDTLPSYFETEWEFERFVNDWSVDAPVLKKDRPF